MLITSKLPHSVRLGQPISVGDSGYRIWMASELKRVLRSNLRALIEKTSGPLKPNESGVTRLLKLGISNGNAQRLLDEDSTVSFPTLEQVAAAFRVKPWDLVSPAMKVSEMPFRDLDVFEGQLITLYRKLSPQERDDHLMALNDRVSEGEDGTAANPFNRRVDALGHVPERRSATRIDERNNMPGIRKRGQQ